MDGLHLLGVFLQEFDQTRELAAVTVEQLKATSVWILVESCAWLELLGRWCEVVWTISDIAINYMAEQRCDDIRRGDTLPGQQSYYSAEATEYLIQLWVCKSSTENAHQMVAQYFVLLTHWLTWKSRRREHHANSRSNPWGRQLMQMENVRAVIEIAI